MESGAPQLHVQLVWHHRPGCYGVSHEERMLVRGAGEADAVHLTDAAASPVTAGDVGGVDDLGAAVGHLDRRGHMRRRLLERDELGVPLHVDAELAKILAEQPLVLVLPEHQYVWERAQVL